MEKIKQFCECDSWDCKAMVEISIEEKQKYLEKELILIVNGHKLNPGDEIVESKKNYFLVKEREE